MRGDCGVEEIAWSKLFGKSKHTTKSSHEATACVTSLQKHVGMCQMRIVKENRNQQRKCHM